jgi:hypothetical protein
MNYVELRYNKVPVAKAIEPRCNAGQFREGLISKITILGLKNELD